MTSPLLTLELRRASRNRRTLVFTMVLPVFFFLSFSADTSAGTLSGLTVAPYVMVSMATYGAMNALFTGCGIIAAERAVGWTRQLRIAGVRGSDYVRTKAFMAYLVAVPALVLVFILGATVRHVHLSAGEWIGAAVSILLCLLPVAAVGVLIGYLVRPQTLQPLFGIGSAFMALLGGLWVPADNFPRALHDAVEVLPTYWAGAAGRSAIQGHWVGWIGLTVVSAWTVGLGAAAAVAYRRDSLRPASAGAT
ncbi:MAG: putative transporter integral rane protein [Acidimicrobiia bacterium]|nr:putative transporter integral rane protein [Acidimicrobiia bacterium]